MGQLSPTQILGSVFPGYSTITGFTWKRLQQNNLIAGSNDAYTVPVGKRLAVFGYTAHNTSGGNDTFNAQIKVGATYFRLETDRVIAADTSGSNTQLAYIAEPGEILSMAVTVGGNLNVFWNALEFPSSFAIYTSKLLALASPANNLIYTVPTGKNAILLDSFLTVNSGGSHLHYVNSSGGVRDTTWNINVPPTNPGPTNRIIGHHNTANITRDDMTGYSSLQSADNVTMTTDAATAVQWAWITTMEASN